MRCMLKVTVGTEAGNRAIKDGTLPHIIGSLVEQLKPEATYFALNGGKRCSYFFFDATDSSNMPPHLEPLFMQLDAEIEFTPCMNQDDLQKGFMAMSM